ncbi:MAG: tRNA dimethylallyltransferase [Alphaproteobacteria bacterium]|nr:tRNA dimethylallyltransferase [Alphaproteobacteria bacterium]
MVAFPDGKPDCTFPQHAPAQAVNAPNAILIAGPTASGKSALALALADKLGGTIINADSMQVYRDLRVITARPTPAEEASAPHRLYGHVDAAENYSAGRWCIDAAAAIAHARQSGRLPIVVGGTGLYFKALTHGLAAVPPIPPDLRAGVRERLQAEGVGALRAELARLDPASAQRLMPGDRARITRALEVVLATGRPLADWHRQGLPPPVERADAVKVFLTVERAELYRRIDARFDAMLASGAIEEVRALAARRLDPSLPAMKAHGVPWILRHLAGEITLQAAAEGGKRDTRRYTKRQGTWFRNQLPDWVWMKPEDAERAVGAALAGSAP